MKNKRRRDWFMKNAGGSYRMSAVLLFFTFVISAAMMMISIAMKIFIDIASGVSDWPLKKAVLFSMVAIVIIGLGEIMASYLQMKITGNIEISMRKSLTEKLFRVPPHIYLGNDTSKLFTYLTSDIQVLSEFIPKKLIGSIILEILMCALSLVLLFTLSWKMALLMLILVPLLMLCMMKFSPVIEKRKNMVLQHEDNNRKLIREILDSNILFRMYSMIQKAVQNLELTYRGKMYENIRLGILSGMLSFLNDFMGMGLFVIAMGYGAFLVKNGEVTVGSLVAIINLVSYLYGPFTHLSGWIASITAVKVSLSRIGEVLEEDDEKYDRQEVSDTSNISIDRIEPQKVDFGYLSGIKILQNLSVTFSKGKLIGVSGASGSGKSTFLHLLMGLLIPDVGEIKLTDKKGISIPAQRIPVSYISYVPNNNGVFSATFMENIIMNELFDETKWNNAIQNANLIKVLSELDGASEFMVDGKGGNLSSGQLQRLCIARAFYKDAQIFIFDEPTSFLDPDSALSVIKALKRLAIDKICIVVTHNKWVLDECEEHYMIDQNDIQSASEIGK